MQPASPHLLLLGCPHLGLDALARRLGEVPGWHVAGELRLTLAATTGELASVLARSQDQLPPDLLRALRIPAADPAATLQALLQRQPATSTMQLLRQLIDAALPARSVLIETEGCLRLQDLERWLDLLMDPALPLRVVHVVEPAAQFVAAASAALGDRLFVAPDYRSHTGLYPQFEPRLVWYRIHRNIDILFESLSPDCRLCVPRSMLDSALRNGGTAALMRCLLSSGDATGDPSLIGTTGEGIADMERRYRVRD